MSATELATADVIRIAQIVDGEQTCEIEGCDRAADLHVVTEPDGEPGYACREHAWTWIDMTTAVLRHLYPEDAA